MSEMKTVKDAQMSNEEITEEWNPNYVWAIFQKNRLITSSKRTLFLTMKGAQAHALHLFLHADEKTNYEWVDVLDFRMNLWTNNYYSGVCVQRIGVWP